MRYRRLIILSIYSLLFCGVSAQQQLNYSFRHISQSDGLLHNQVLSIVQDGRGFIWVATANGLQRYDGSRFVYYPEMLSSPAGVLTSGVDMYADKNNNQLWISNFQHIEKMDLVKYKFTLYNKEMLATDSSFIFSKYFGPNNEQWLLSRNAVYKYDSSTKKYISYSSTVFPANLSHSTSIADDSVGNSTWVTNGYQLYLFDKKNKKVYSENYNPGNHPLLKLSDYGPDGKNFRFIMADSRQNIWVTTWGDLLLRYDNETKKIQRYSLSAIKRKQDNGKISGTDPGISCIIEDDHHNTWLATEGGGLLRYNEEKDIFDYCIVQDNSNEGIRYNYSIYAIFQDKEQNIWLGTDKGISIFNPYRQYFRSVRHQKDNSLSMPKNEITSALQTTGGDIFIGTWGGGMAVYDSRLNFKQNVFLKGSPMQKNFIWSLLQVDAETLWIGCQHGWLQVFNTVTGATQSLHPPEMEGSTILCMKKDADGNILFGLYNGKMVKWDKQQQKFHAFSDNSTGGRPVTTIFIDRDRQCWVSTIEGFKQFDPDKMIYTGVWLYDSNKVTSLYGKSCRGIEEYNDSILLVGTIYGGLNLFNKRTRTFSHLTMTDGLPANNIYAIKKDSAGYIWFTTDYGLCKLNLAENKIIPYGMPAGLVNAAFVSNEFLPLQDGHWLTFTGTEAISFLPANPEYQNKDNLKIEITGFKVLDTPLPIDSFLQDNNPVRLSYKNNFITIEFAALTFSNLLPTNYYYRLSGVDKDWVSGGTTRFANYTGLPPGEYTFDVRSTQGSHMGAITSFKLVITPPFWKTAWFKILCILIITGLLYAVAKWRINMIRNEAKNKMHFTKQMAVMEMKALRSQMNPHFIFNCINSIDALIQNNDKYQATIYLNKFAKLIRNVLDSSNESSILFSEDMDALQLYVDLEKLRSENKFSAQIDVSKELLNSDYKVPPLIVQSFVENAIHHGLRNREDSNGILQIIVQRIEDTIQYTIADNGIGREAAGKLKKDEHQSYGMQMSIDRVKMFNEEENASVKIEDLYEKNMAAGTQVRVTLKIK